MGYARRQVYRSGYGCVKQAPSGAPTTRWKGSLTRQQPACPATPAIRIAPAISARSRQNSPISAAPKDTPASTSSAGAASNAALARSMIASVPTSSRQTNPASCLSATLPPNRSGRPNVCPSADMGHDVRFRFSVPHLRVPILVLSPLRGHRVMRTTTLPRLRLLSTRACAFAMSSKANT